MEQCKTVAFCVSNMEPVKFYKDVSGRKNGSLY